MNVLSLFSGIGGLDLGLERAGMRTVGHVEIEPYCRRVLARHWPEVPQHDDVRTAPAWWTSQVRPRVDLVAGGPPCQGHSVAGRQLGMGDERWGWPWFRDVLDATEAPVALIENSPNLVRTGLVDILGDLAGRGFDARWLRVPVAAFGGPSLRWRLFVIAARSPWARLREPDLERRTVHGFDGAVWSVADPDGTPGRCETGDPVTGTGATEMGLRPAEPGRRGSAVADSAGEGLPQRAVREPGPDGSSEGRGDVIGDGRAHRALDWRWDPEPDVARVAPGAAHRVDRTRAIGNCVAPPVGEYIGRLLLASVELVSQEEEAA